VFSEKALLFTFCSNAVFAISGPVFWQGYPSAEVLSVEDNSQIIVQNENLVFDFYRADDDSFIISGKVTQHMIW